MNFKKIRALAFAATAMTIAYAAPASAQATRTWVSGVGDDANPCSRTAPCKTFAGAISKTATGGEINCIDPGGFGGVTITKSITIDCTATMGGLLVAGTPGITVNGTDINVILRGLTINGLSLATTPGTFGVRVANGASVTLENIVIENFVTGIAVNSGVATELYVSNSLLVTNGQPGATSGAGIEVAPATGGSAKVTLRSTRIINGSNIGVRLNTTNTTAAAGIVAVLDNVEISGGAQGVVLLTPASTTTASAMISNSTIANNSGFGIVASGTTATARIGSSTITGNGTGIAALGGSSVRSFGSNKLAGNTNDGAFTAPVLPRQ